MIWVDELRACGAPWRGGVACHMISDDSVEELVSFAAALGCPRHWFQRTTNPHYDISPRLRGKAIGWGARACTAREMVAHNQGRCDAERARADAALAELEGRARGHHGSRRR
jgi:hypothetical protein